MTHARRQQARLVKYQGISRRQLQRPPIGRLRAAPVPVVGHPDPAHARVPFSEIRFQRERTRDRFPRTPIPLHRGGPAPVRFARVGPCQLGLSERELGLEDERLLQITDSSRGVLAREAIDEVPSLQIEPVRFGVGTAAFHRRRDGRGHLVACFRVRGLAQQRRPQLLHHRLRDIVLHREDVLQRSIVGLRPELIPVCDLHQLHRDPHPVAGLAHAAPLPPCP